MRLWPRSLFGRLALLLVAVLAIALLAIVLLFRQDRAALVARHLGDTKIVQLKALRAALEASNADERWEATRRLSREYGVRIIPESERRMLGAPAGPLFADLETRLTNELGAGTEVRIMPRAGAIAVKIDVAGTGYWVALPMPPRPPDDGPQRALAASLAIVAALLVAAFLFARYLARPLRELEGAVAQIGRGEEPAPLPEAGPSEIAKVNRGFNAMAQNLRQMERDRAVLLAGVSHDLRTPLARLRLGVELAGGDPSTRDGMIADIGEMDRVIGQFLDFARGEEATAAAPCALDAIVAPVVARYAQAGNDVRFAAGAVPALPLRPTAIARLVQNLIDNALAYGAPPVDVSTWQRGNEVVLDVADRGPGVPAADVERLKQPFTRASAARARADGAPGAGLGLAIVDRIARLHHGRLDLLPRDGGGTVARVTLPLTG